MFGQTRACLLGWVLVEEYLQTQIPFRKFIHGPSFNLKHRPRLIVLLVETMGVEILGAVQGQAKAGTEGENTFLNEIDGGKPIQCLVAPEPIKFGLVDSSHGANGSTKGEADVAIDDKLPKDAVDEWPEAKQIHSFYFIKFRSYENPKLKMKLDQADKEIQRKNQARSQITEALKAKRSERALLIEKLKPLTSQQKEYKRALDEKKKELEPLQAALGKLRSANNATREKGVTICSSEEELNERIQSLQYRIQHESNTLAEEKQFLREIKQLEGTRDKVIAHEAMQAKIQDSLGQREAIQDHVKLIGGDLDGVRKEQQAIWAKIKHLEDDLKIIDDEIHSLQEELTAVIQNKDKAYETLTELRKERDEGNICFYQYRSLLINAKDLAAKKDITALQELSHRETEKFMSLWSGSKDFRDDYVRRILPSLDNRQLSRDGRMRNPDEKPLIQETPTVVETQDALAKAGIKGSKGDANIPSRQDPVPTTKVQKEETNKPTEANKKGNLLEDEEIFSVAIPVKESPATNAVDPMKLKEMRREEEMAKAKLALERKKKLAEKAATKATLRAQKEAEKKIKEHKKKAKKKAGIGAPSEEAEEQNEGETNNAEAENVEEKVVSPVAASKNNIRKENVRHRNRSKPQGSLSKVILKRKQASSHWLWAAPAAVLVLALGVLGYYIVSLKN